MDNYVGNDTFEFGSKESIVPAQDMNAFQVNDYQSNNTFNAEVANVEPISQPQMNVFENDTQIPAMVFPNEQENPSIGLETVQQVNSVPEVSQSYNDVFNMPESTINPFVAENSLGIVNEAKEQITNEPTLEPVLPTANPFVVPESLGVVEQTKQELVQNDFPAMDQTITQEPVVETVQAPVLEQNAELPIEEPEVVEEPKHSNEVLITDEMLYEQEVQFPEETPRTITMSDDNLEELTEFKKEDDVKTTDIKSLFDRVGVNVREASDIFKRNTEMKEKIDSRFEELKKLQADVSKVKKAQYDEINAYKEEVLSRLTEKKDEIEIRLNKLKEFQTSLEKEKIEFEQYRKEQKEEIERVQKEVQDAYDSRREELKRIEDVLRKQKDLLDEERNQLNLDKIQYESDKNELANNLLKFNEIVGSFTNGIDKIDKE